MSQINVGKLNLSTGLVLPLYSSSNFPSGQTAKIIVDSDQNKLKIYDGTTWRALDVGITASGGTETIIGGYKIHTFTSSNNLTILTSGLIEYMIVAGGGGGGGTIGGGGGAGGVLTGKIYLPASTYQITVGNGGLGAIGYNNAGQTGSNGQDSTAFGLTALGGGGGSGWSGHPPRSGGSGGGSVASQYKSQIIGSYNGGGFGQRGQGHDGGGGLDNRGGGGGGAGEPGRNGNGGSTHGGKGGDGIQTNISGVLTYYGGGGAGGVRSGFGAPEQPGLGGGGTGTSTSVKAGDGQPNTGGGGGGAGYNGPNTARIGGSGGSGIVIVRYLV